jgi:hypothetical protein
MVQASSPPTAEAAGRALLAEFFRARCEKCVETIKGVGEEGRPRADREIESILPEACIGFLPILPSKIFELHRAKAGPGREHAVCGIGCGGGGGRSSGGNSGTTSGTYTVTLTGTSGSVTGTGGTITLTVQ